MGSLRIWEKISEIIKSFIKFNISEHNMYEFCCRIFVGISEEQAALIKTEFLILVYLKVVNAGGTWRLKLGSMLSIYLRKISVTTSEQVTYFL